jgi:NAD(P)-dependent dehydrogenase (short-subunit alcohol dehydrogenase family)
MFIDNYLLYAYNSLTLKEGKKMKDFKGKVAVITGAASGIGFGLAERCAQEGMKVVLAGINEDTLKKAEKDIKKNGSTTLVVKTDVSKAEDVKKLAEKTMDTYGAVHLLFNNAGVLVLSTTWESTLADWEWVLGVNLWGVIHGIHFFVPLMLKQDTESHIINTASSAGLMVTDKGGNYSVSKHAVVALSETLYREMEQGGYNIGVSVLCPWAVRTKMLESERNRPLTLMNKLGEGLDTLDPEFQASLHFLKQLHEKGMPPQRVGDIVFEAIKAEKFYILPDAERFMPLVKARMEDILQVQNPRTIPVDFN